MSNQQNADELTARSANGRMLQRRALIDHLPSTDTKGVIGRYVLPHGTSLLLVDPHGFLGAGGDALYADGGGVLHYA